MTPREQILTILKGGCPDRVPWFGDLDYWATARIHRHEVPPDFKTSPDYLEWHRDLGVGFYLQGYFPFRTIIENCHIREWREGHKAFREIDTPRGKLRECWQWMTDSFSDAPVEFLLKSENDLPAFQYLYENTRYEPDYAFARQRYEMVGDQGIVLVYLPRSPFMQLVAEKSGIENLTFMILNAPDAVAETFAVMRKAHDLAAQITLDSPAEALMIPENLSSEVVGRRFFDAYVREYQEHWLQKVAQAGKYSFIHVDGTLRGLLGAECRVGATVLEALTPHPVGDVPVAEWADFAESDRPIFWGGLPGSYFTPRVSDAEFERHVKEILAVMRTRPRYVLGVADQIPPDVLEARVRRVQHLVAEFGVYH